MKMNKTAVAIALAGVAAAPLAQAQVTLTGQVAVGMVGSDADGAAGDFKTFGDDATINVKAEGELDSGLTGYANYRTDLGLVGDNAVGDNIHVGIKGDFGDIRLGEVPDAIEYGQVAGDILADITTENAGISYTGTFGSATVGLVFSPEGSTDKIGAGIKFSVGGFSVGVGGGTVGDDSLMSAGVTFGLGGATLAAAYKDFDNDRQTIGAKASYGVGKATLALTYEAEAGDVNDGDNKIRFDAGYDLGSSMTISTRVNVFTDDSDSANDVTDYRLLLTKAF